MQGTDRKSPKTAVRDARDRIPATLTRPGAARFWLAVVLAGIGAGASAAALSLVLSEAQHLAWPSANGELLDAAAAAGPWRHIFVLLCAGLLTGLAQIVLGHLSSANSIEITTALWFAAGRLPPLRTLGSALLSVIIVAMGASLGREGAPKQTGAVIANALSDRGGFSDEQRKLLVACGAGAGMAAVYDVPLGGALFALEVLRGALALRFVLPALTASLIATMVAWVVIPNAPLYRVAGEVDLASVVIWALVAGVICGLASVGYVRLIALADRSRPKGRLRLIAPTLAFGLLGWVSKPGFSKTPVKSRRMEISRRRSIAKGVYQHAQIHGSCQFGNSSMRRREALLAMGLGVAAGLAGSEAKAELAPSMTLPDGGDTLGALAALSKRRRAAAISKPCQ